MLGIFLEKIPIVWQLWLVLRVKLITQKTYPRSLLPKQHEPRKKNLDTPWETGCLIGILIICVLFLLTIYIYIYDIYIYISLCSSIIPYTYVYIYIFTRWAPTSYKWSYNSYKYRFISPGYQFMFGHLYEGHITQYLVQQLNNRWLTVPTYWFIFGPLTNLPFGMCAIYFDLKVP